MAAEASVEVPTGGSMLSATLQWIYETLDSVDVVDFIHENKLNDGQLKKLRMKLLSADTLANDAETKQLKDLNVRKWLAQLYEAIYDADDLVDQISAEALRCKMEEDHSGSGTISTSSSSSSGKKVLNSISTEFNNQVDQKIEEILDRLESILDQKDALGLKDVGVQIKSLGRLRATNSSVTETEIYGREADKECIISMLLKDDGSGDNISVIAIVGMGGIGKTTLAQTIYNDVRVDAYFKIKGWACVSNDFNVFRIAKLLFETFTSQTGDITDLNLLQAKSKQVLMGKKFLLVLDDVWFVDYGKWNALKSCFESGARGSKIIVTTRRADVAKTMGTVCIHWLELMSEMDSWALFCRHVFGNVNSSVDGEYLEAIGKEMVHISGGHPLTLKCLAGMLHCEPNPHEWRNILEKLHELSDNGNILRILWFTYFYLPSCVKGCFAYCFIFPQDYAFPGLNLIYLWMAERLLPPQKNMRLEDIGAYCIDDLKLRSFFSNQEGLITMHDLVNDLAAFIAAEFYWRLDDNCSYKPLNKIRYVSQVNEYHYGLTKYEDLSEAKRLRTLFLSSQLHFDNSLLAKLLPILTCLRVLSLYRCSITELPVSIGNLKLLRYLDVSCTDIEQLPQAVCTLYNLQTLLLYSCRKLARLPANIGRLINLRHLDIRYTHVKEMPPQIGDLKDMQTLKDFIFGYIIRSLRDLQHLQGSLRILRLENVVDVEDVWVGNLKDKQYLSELQFSWSFYSDDCQKHREVLNGLQPHTNIKVLRIENYGGEGFPNWVGDHSFVNMEVIHLKGCKNCSLLPPLGLLPFLKELYVEGFHGVLTIDDGFYTNGSSATVPFRSLKILHFSKLLLWKKWSFIEGAFPCLESLYLEDCPKLNVSISIRLPSLQTMKIFNCPELESFAEMRLPSKLNSLYVSKCKKLFSRRMEWNLQKLTFLRHLFIDSMYEAGLDSFPEEGFLPVTLVSLEIYNVPFLKGLNSKSFQHLDSLEKLGIFGCPELQCLPEEGLPASLSLLCIRGCPLLYRKREEGEDWPEISHIPSVKIER